MRIAMGQINPVIGDFDGNAKKILVFVQRANLQGVDLIVFPEMCICGYPPIDLLDHESFVEANLKALEKIKQRASPGIGIVLGYVDRNRSHSGKNLVNAVSFIEKGRV